MRKIFAGTLLAATTAAGLGLAATGAQAATAAKAPPRCHIGDLKAGFTKANNEDGMNHTGWILSLTNSSRHTCYVSGYADLGLLNGHHKRIHTKTDHGSTYFVRDPGAHKVVLKPGQRAVADLEYSHIRQEGTEYAVYLQVTPPGEKGHRIVSMGDRYVFHGEIRLTAFASKLPF